MLQLQRLAVERVGEQDVVVVEDVERQVGRVALLGVADDVRRGRADLGHLEDRLDRDALPGRVELRPAGDAVDVGVDLLARQRLELVPGQGERGSRPRRRPGSPTSRGPPAGRSRSGGPGTSRCGTGRAGCARRWRGRRCWPPKSRSNMGRGVLVGWWASPVSSHTARDGPVTARRVRRVPLPP